MTISLMWYRKEKKLVGLRSSKLKGLWITETRRKRFVLLLCKFDVSTQNLTYLLFNITPTSHRRSIPLRVQISFTIIHFSILNIEYIKESAQRNENFNTQSSNGDSRDLWLPVKRKSKFINFQLHKFQIFRKCFMPDTQMQIRHKIVNQNSMCSIDFVWYQLCFLFSPDMLCDVH